MRFQLQFIAYCKKKSNIFCQIKNLKTPIDAKLDTDPNSNSVFIQNAVSAYNNSN